jgi:hypothetical protein
MIQGLDDPVTVDEAHGESSARRNGSLALNMSRRHNRAVSGKSSRKKKVVEFFSSASPEPPRNIVHDENPGRRRQEISGVSVAQPASSRSHAHSSPQLSPPLNRLVTQLPVSSMDVEDASESSAPDQTLLTQQVPMPEAMEIDSSPESDGQNAENMEVDSGALNQFENVRQPIVRHLWELDDDEDGLDDADINLNALLQRQL